MVASVCPQCEQAIDPEVCWCGDRVEQHTQDSGHPVIPMGCDCGRAAPQAGGSGQSRESLREEVQNIMDSLDDEVPTGGSW